jgi:hypothetical protein
LTRPALFLETSEATLNFFLDLAWPTEDMSEQLNNYEKQMKWRKASEKRV